MLLTSRGYWFSSHLVLFVFRSLRLGRISEFSTEAMMIWELPISMMFFHCSILLLSKTSMDLFSSYRSRKRKVMMDLFNSCFGFPKGLEYRSILSTCSSWIQKVLTISFNSTNFPTTYYNTVKGHTNSHVQRVYKYPLLASFSNQVRVDLISVVLYPSLHLSFFRAVYNYITNTPGFFFGGMSTSPRSVLDPSFQCEAVPICLVERSSSSLENALRRTLAGRLLIAKRPSIPNLTLAVSRLWNCTHRLSCYDHGKCLYSFEFTYAPDVERVVSGGPWYVNGDMLLISRMNPNQSIEQLPFSYAKLWVRCYDLPPMCFTKDYAEAIGNSLGKFCETDLPPEDPDEALLLVQKIPTVRKYLRVKFEFNLYGPLKSTQGIKICNAEKVVVAEYVSRLTYERLPHVCFRCGFLGHLIEECSFEGPQIYGEWIRAERFFRINFQNSDIPKVTLKEGQPSSSAENRVTQISNMAELVNTMINDPDIVRADYSLARAKGPLPNPKGKAPAIEVPQSAILVPYSNVSPPKNMSTAFGPSGDSILGTVPSFLRSLNSPIGSESIQIDSDEGQFASYLNSITSHEEVYASNARCLFKSDALATVGLAPVGLSSDKGQSSLGLMSPINSGEVSANKNVKANAQLSEIFKDELRKLPIRKRIPGNSQATRPKRGRQATNTEEPG